ncbi:MAG: N-acetyltransferase [bacterium]|nr:N-acetyltransferase [bacterium]MDI1335363.1 N-acetyltransferase [Lacunisphaera sp.]
MAIEITPMRGRADCEWAAQLMASSEPWLTLGRDHATVLHLLRNPAKDVFLVRTKSERAGFLVLDLNGPLGGYIQTIGITPEKRGAGLGTAALRWAEKYIFASQPNILLCVSSFNRGAARLYRRLGYAVVGRLPDYIVAGHDEILLRKTRGPLSPTRRRAKN